MVSQMITTATHGIRTQAQSGFECWLPQEMNPDYDILYQLGAYVLTVILALAIQQFVVYSASVAGAASAGWWCHLTHGTPQDDQAPLVAEPSSAACARARAKRAALRASSTCPMSNSAKPRAWPARAWPERSPSASYPAMSLASSDW
mgnify:CR=1 FL=1